VVDLNGLAAEDVVVECVIGRVGALGEFLPAQHVRFDAAKEAEPGIGQIYRVDLAAAMADPELVALRHYEVRAYPRHRLEAHPFECGFVRWL
jgi:hypothetical protein